MSSESTHHPHPSPPLSLRSCVRRTTKDDEDALRSLESFACLGGRLSRCTYEATLRALARGTFFFSSVKNEPPRNTMAQSHGGALTQLIALGAADKYLSQNPSITFFRFRYNRYTNFAMEAIEQPFNTMVTFGQDCSLTFNRTGDLLYWTYVVITLPGIYGCDRSSREGGSKLYGPSLPPCGSCHPERGYPDICAAGGGIAFPGLPPNCDACGDQSNDGGASNSHYPEDQTPPFAHWTNAIGQWLIRRSSIVIGGQVIDTLYADYLYMWEELSGKPGKRLMEMVGKDTSLQNLIEDSRTTRRLYVPLPFWFTQTSGNALPVVSLQFHGIQLHVCFQELATCIQTSCTSPNNRVTVLRCGNDAPVIDTDLKANVESTYVYLDIDERDRFATGSFEQLICQLQSYTMTTRVQQVQMALNFNHPIIELIWAVRRVCQANANNNFCYSGRGCLDPIKTVQLKLNNLPRFPEKEGRYFRLVQPWQYHTNIPDSHIYCYSFALHPEEAQPSGSCNFSRIDNIELTLTMQDNLSMTEPGGSMPGCNIGHNSGDFQCIVYGRNWNVLRFREGLGGIAFSN